MPVPITTFACVAITHDLWHACLGHVGGEAAHHAACFADGVAVTSSDLLSVCKSCIVGKHPCKPFHPSEVARSAGFLNLVDADVAGPMPVRTPHGRCYFLVILDDFTHTLDLHLLTMKDQALDAWESTRHHWETKLSRRVKEFQSDNGGEFINSAFISALDMASVSHRLSVPYMHQQNGVAECIICTIKGHLLAMLHFASLPQTYWGEAALTVAYLHNHTESRALPSGQTPYEMLHGQRPNLSHLRVWGCRAFAHIPLEMQAKLGPKSREVLFMGYPPGVKGYRVRDIVTGQFFNSRDVIFNENFSLLHLTGDEPVPAGPVAIGNVGEDDEETETPVSSADATVMSCDAPTDSSPPHALTPPNAPSSTTLPLLHHSSRSQILTVAGRAFQEDLECTKAHLAQQTALPSIETSMPLSPHSCTSDSSLLPLMPLLDTPDSIASADDAPPLSDAIINLVIAEQAHLAIWSDTCRDLGSPGYDMGIPPATYDEAMRRSDVNRWHTAMDKEVTLLQDMKVYDLVPLPPGLHAIGSRWVLEYKSGDGKGGPVEKAHFVTKGFTQISGHDFGRTFAPVAHQSSIRVITAHCTKEDWELHSLNIKCAFLHGKIEEEVYIKQPRGYEKSRPNGETLVGRLNSSLYGIKQAAYEFYKILQEELVCQGFIWCEIDHAVFFFHRNGVFCLLAWHVDDGMAGSNNDSSLDETKRCLHAQFGITDMGAIKKYLGIQFKHDQTTRELWIYQAEYICHLLHKYGLSNCHPVLLPMDPNNPFLQDKDAAKLPKMPDLSSCYPKIIGELLYLSVCTCPDIAHAVQCLSQHLSHPTPRLFAAAKCVLRYLAGTVNYRLYYGGAIRMGDLHGFSDADWATCPKDCISITGYCWFYHGGVISHVSKKQSTQALSITEAEVYGNCHCIPRRPVATYFFPVTQHSLSSSNSSLCRQRWRSRTLQRSFEQSSH